MNKIDSCPVCGSHDFSVIKILWQELITDWQLSPAEVSYIDRQQGFLCVSCGNSLRSMALAAAILKAYEFSGTLEEFVQTELANTLRVLEINEAGGLTKILAKMQNHKIVKYPEYDMTNLSFESGIFDLVIHSDTLEHVPQPIAGLSECRRVLEFHGKCIFTVPIVVGRMSRQREGLKNCYHGLPELKASDCLVYTEFGADIWCYVAQAGFKNVKIHCFDYPAGIAIEASLQ